MSDEDVSLARSGKPGVAIDPKGAGCHEMKTAAQSLRLGFIVRTNTHSKISLSSANNASWVRLFASNLRESVRTCIFTLDSLISRSRAISLLALPLQIACSTFFSLGERWYGSGFSLS